MFEKVYGTAHKKRKSTLQGIIKQDVFSVYNKCKKEENNTGTENQKDLGA